MAKYVTFRAPMRSGRTAAGPHDVSLAVTFTMDPTDATETAVSPAVTLPKGAIIDCFLVEAAGTGGSSPTILMGDTTNTNGIFNNFPADDGDGIVTFGRATVIGSEFDNTPLPRDYTLVYLGGSGTDATGGLITMTCLYHMDTVGELGTPGTIIDPSSE